MEHFAQYLPSSTRRPPGAEGLRTEVVEGLPLLQPWLPNLATRQLAASGARCGGRDPLSALSSPPGPLARHGAPRCVQDQAPTWAGIFILYLVGGIQVIQGLGGDLASSHWQPGLCQELPSTRAAFYFGVVERACSWLGSKLPAILTMYLLLMLNSA